MNCLSIAINPAAKSLTPASMEQLSNLQPPCRLQWHGQTGWKRLRRLSNLILAWVFASTAFAGNAPPAHPTLELSGATGTLADNIRAYVNLEHYPCDIEAWRLKRLVKQARQQTQEALHALGYYQADQQLQAQRNNGCWSLSIQVDPGPRIQIHTIDVTITGGLEKLPGSQSLLRNLPIKRGTGLNHADYEATKQAIESLASLYGYFDGHFTRQRLRIDPQAGVADVILQYASGPRYRLGKISVNETRLSRQFLQEYIKLKEGDFYNSEDLTLQQQLLVNSGYFSAVEVLPDRNAMHDQRIPITINTSPRKRHAYKLGLGVSTDTGPRASFNFENRWLNRRGHHYDVETRTSRITQEITFNYMIPLGDAGTHQLGLSLGYRDEDTDTSKSTSTKYGAELTRFLGNRWKRTLTLDSLVEAFSTADARDRTQIVSIGAGLSKTVSDDPLYPRSGWRLSGRITGARQDWLSDIDLLQATGGAKLIRPWGQARLIARGAMGWTEVSEFARLPASMRFYAGGDSSVRGFGYKRLGPVDAEGAVTGGKHMLSGSLELEHPIRSHWGIAVFFDAGNAFNNFDTYDIEKAAGFGIRYHSPVGPIRVDIARDLAYEKAFRIHLSMGPDL